MNDHQKSLVLGEAEHEIDSLFKANPLLGSPFAHAAWMVLTAWEGRFTDRPARQCNFESLVNRRINYLKYPLRWLSTSCQPAGRPVAARLRDDFQAADKLLTLANRYEHFETWFLYWRKGKIDLDVSGNEIIPIHDFTRSPEYEAYNRLTRPGVVPPDMSQIFAEIERKVRVDRDRFSIRVDPRLIGSFMRVAESLTSFRLPLSWRFSRYTMRDFRQVNFALTAIAAIHFKARISAIEQGCQDRGLKDAVLVTNKHDLVTRVARYAESSESIVREVLGDLTWGAGNMVHPDPALQPVVPLSLGRWAIAPNLLVYAAPERNFCVLLNRLPAERGLYLELAKQKEDLMRQEIEAATSGKNLRIWSGKVQSRADLPDVDCALISDAEGFCLLMQLKWFIGPDEVREMIEKGEEIRKGITQAQRLQHAFEDGQPSLAKALGIPSAFEARSIVVTADFIGLADDQDPATPVINLQPLCAKLLASENLREVGSWLFERRYLPRQGKEFEMEEDKFSLGRWKTSMYDVKPLVDRFDPASR